jgi:hypothetical protein
MIYGPINDISIRKTRYNYELYTPSDEIDIVKVMEMRRLSWLGQLFRIQELNTFRHFTLLKPEDTRRVGKLKLSQLSNWRLL